MPRPEVHVTLSGRRLRIDGPSASPVFGPLHRIFFTNVLAMNVDEEKGGYVTGEGMAPLPLLLESVRYLSDAGFTVRLNQPAMQIVAKAKSGEQELQLAKSTGRALKNQKRTTALTIPGLKRSLTRYQIPAVRHLVGVAHAANFSVPGSGKTAIVLSSFEILRRQRVVDKLVVICPRSAFMPWEDEVRATLRAGLRTMRVVGSRTRRAKLYRTADDVDLVLLTYQMASNDADHIGAFLRRHKVMLVLDESHNIKRLEGGKWAEAVIGIAPLATKRVILSGTPVPHSVLDLWSQMEFLWPQNSPLGDREEFKYRTEANEESVVAAARDALFPLYWRIKKEDLGLPAPRFYRVPVPMSQYQRAIYQVIGAKVLADLVRAPAERLRLRMWRRARMVRLLQTASNPALLARYSIEFKIPPLDASGLPIDQLVDRYSDFEMPAKLSTAVELTRKLVRQDRKVLIWTAFIQNIRSLEHYLKDLRPAVLYGAIPRDESEDQDVNREKIIRNFKAGRHPVLIANPSACAESVSLHKVCRDAVYYDRTFNAAHYMQSLDRIHRIGLERHERVRYYLLLSQDSIDEVIDHRLEEKIGRMRRLLNEDFGVLDLESPEDEFSEETEEERDFEALVAALRRQIV